MERNVKKIIFILSSVLLVILSYFAGYFSVQRSNVGNSNTAAASDIPTESIDPAKPEEVSQRNLRISVNSNGAKDCKVILPKELGGNFDNPITYFGLRNVMIEIEGKDVKLENAIRDGYVSVAEMFAYARMDAKGGICTETFESTNGLTKFVYRYPEFDLNLVYDVYETPDGNQHLINDISLSKIGVEHPRLYADDTGTLIDREDWGLTFNIVDKAATYVTIDCTQADGQQNGELVTHYFHLLTSNKERIPDLEKRETFYHSLPQDTIAKNRNTQIKIDWSNIYGELPGGHYILYLQISDIYDANKVHPLMKNYYDEQIYTIEFTLP